MWIVNRMSSVKNGDLVVPGDQLCVIEEMSPSFGTYEKDGVVFATTAGGVSIDLKARSISVLGPDGIDKLALPIQGDIMVGEVIRAYESRAEVSLVKRNGKDLLNPLLGEIRIGNVTRRFVKSMHDVIRAGDIIRAVALTTHKISTELSVVGPDLGVILGRCARCGNDLVLTTHNNMVCLRCENHETREAAKDYGVMFGLEARPDLAPRRRSYGDRGGGDRRYGDRRGGDRRGGDRRGGHRNSYRDGDRRPRRR